MKKTEEELDKLHELVINGLYETFEEEFKRYFRFERAALDILEMGRGSFPFSNPYDCMMEGVSNCLDVIEKNILEHIKEQVRIIYEEKKPSLIICEEYEQRKKLLWDKIKESINELG